MINAPDVKYEALFSLNDGKVRDLPLQPLVKRPRGFLEMDYKEKESHEDVAL